MRLALELGYANPDAMLREMTANHLKEWEAYYAIEPWGVSVLDALFARFQALFINSQLKKGKSPVKVSELLLFKEKGNPAYAPDGSHGSEEYQYHNDGD